MQILYGKRVNVTRHFADGGSVTNEVIVYSQFGATTDQVEADAYNVHRNHTAIPTDLEQRRVTSIDFTYVGPA